MASLVVFVQIFMKLEILKVSTIKQPSSLIKPLRKLNLWVNELKKEKKIAQLITIGIRLFLEPN